MRESHEREVEARQEDRQALNHSHLQLRNEISELQRAIHEEREPISRLNQFLVDIPEQLEPVIQRILDAIGTDYREKQPGPLLGHR